MNDQKIVLWFFLILVLLAPYPAATEQDNQAAATGPEPSAAWKRADPASSPHRSDGPTWFELKNVHFRIDETVILEIAYLRGELLSRVEDAPPTFDDKNSLLMKIEAGEAAMSTAAFSDLLNRYVFNYPDTPLTNIKVSTQGSQIKQEATMRKGVAVPTEMLGTLDVLPDGRIRFHPTTIKAAGVPSTTLMDFFGIEVEELIKGTAPRGVEIMVMT